MTLRQLRQVASELGVTLYSRKTKEELVSAIGQRQGGLSATAVLSSPDQERDLEPSGQAETRVVFLPRDPQWAYVLWEISEADRNEAFKVGASQLCLRVADVTGLSGGEFAPRTLAWSAGHASSSAVVTAPAKPCAGYGWAAAPIDWRPVWRASVQTCSTSRC